MREYIIFSIYPIVPSHSLGIRALRPLRQTAAYEIKVFSKRNIK
jgi:hypothetical protein